MKFVVIALSLFASSFAQADGFNCETESGLNVKIYNHTSPSEGTRVPAVMVISDSFVGKGNKTIARFADANGVLSLEGKHLYNGKVDLRFNDSKRKGELLAGTKLGFVSDVLMAVDFSYAYPVAAGYEMPATFTVIKRDGSATAEDAVCTRYLKN